MRNKKHYNVFSFLAPLLLFAAGAGIFLYPAISNLLAEMKQKNVIETYEARVAEADEAELEKQWQEAVIYNENLAGDPVHDPFVLGSGYVLPDNYEQILNVDGNGVMGYIDIPKISVHLPIYHGTGEEVLAKGAGHLEATALPVGSVGGHSVVSAHRGLPSAELFTRLNKMEIGDTFYIHVLNKILAYEVDQIEVIEPEELSLLSAEADRDLVTLLTCTPYGINTHRLLVRGTRVPYEPTTETPKPFWQRGIWPYIYLAMILLAVTGYVVYRHFHKKKQSEQKHRRKRWCGRRRRERKRRKGV